MNKEEKKAIKALQVLSKRIEMVRINSFGLGKEERDILDYVYNPSKAIITVLNLIEKQQKEIEHWKAGMKIVERDKNNHIERLEKELDNIKEIEKSHKEENGKLRVKLTKQEKMIEYMVNWINDHEDPFEGCHENEKCGDDYISCEQCIKQYFEKKAKEVN